MTEKFKPAFDESIDNLHNTEKIDDMNRPAISENPDTNTKTTIFTLDRPVRIESFTFALEARQETTYQNTLWGRKPLKDKAFMILKRSSLPVTPGFMSETPSDTAERLERSGQTPEAFSDLLCHIAKELRENKNQKYQVEVIEDQATKLAAELTIAFPSHTPPVLTVATLKETLRQLPLMKVEKTTPEEKEAEGEMMLNLAEAIISSQESTPNQKPSKSAQIINAAQNKAAKSLRGAFIAIDTLAAIQQKSVTVEEVTQQILQMLNDKKEGKTGSDSQLQSKQTEYDNAQSLFTKAFENWQKQKEPKTFVHSIGEEDLTAGVHRVNRKK